MHAGTHPHSRSFFIADSFREMWLIDCILALSHICCQYSCIVNLEFLPIVCTIVQEVATLTHKLNTDKARAEEEIETLKQTVKLQVCL